MAIAEEKRKKLTEWGLSESLISQLERRNSKDASTAIEAGKDSKEVVEEVAVEDAAETEVVENVEETQEPVANLAQMEEVSGVLGQAVNALIELNESVKELRLAHDEVVKEVQALKEQDQERLARKAMATPLASLSELLNKSVIGNVDAKVDGRTALAKDAPEQSEPETQRRTGIPFVDSMIGNTDRS